jgi:hypothetical protein
VGAYEDGYNYLVQTYVIELNGTLGRADLTRFQYFHALRRTWPIAILAALILILFVPALGFVYIAYPEFEWRTVITNAIPFALLLAFWIYVLGIMPYRHARKALATQSYLREPIDYIFTEETISGTGRSAQWSVGWNVMKRIIETKSLFLLYHHSNVAVVVPKRFFQSASEMDTWRQFAAMHMDSKQIDKPGFVARLC